MTLRRISHLLSVERVLCVLRNIRFLISKYNTSHLLHTNHAEGGCERASDRSLEERGVSCTLSICDTFERMFVVIERNRNRQPDMYSKRNEDKYSSTRVLISTANVGGGEHAGVHRLLHDDVRSPCNSGSETVACEAGGATVGQHERGSLRGWCGGTENV